MKKITISMLVIFFLTTSLSLTANDTITIVWKGNSMKNFSMASTAGEQYTINWGDGSPIQTFTGDGVFQPHYYVYGPGEYYTATISGVTPECSFTEFECDPRYDPLNGYFYNQVTELYTHLCPALQRLSCWGNLISSLDLSANTALQFLNCAENQLSNLDLHTNTALIELNCNVNQLTNLDLSNNPLLTHFACGANLLTVLDISNNTLLESLQFSYNQLTNIDISNHSLLCWLTCSNNLLTSLDVSTNTELELLWCSNNPLFNLDVSANVALRDFRCSENMLTSLDVSTNTNLGYLRCNDNLLSNLDITALTKLNSIRCYNNRLQLSNLYQISKQASSASDKQLGTQMLDTLNIMIGDIVDYSEQVMFGGATIFVVEKNGAPALQSDYSLTYGILTFHTNGNYKITMTNSAITSDPQYPAKVIAAIIVVAEIDDAALSFLGVSGGKLQPAFHSNIYDYSVNIPYNIEEISITAIPRNSFATVAGTGTFALEVGENIFIVTVTAEDGVSELEYSITITRAPPSNDASLRKLSVSKGKLEPAFASYIYKYSVNVAYNIEEIAITATPNNLNATVSGTGTFSLEEGENIFIVTVTAEDGVTKQEYEITINRILGINEVIEGEDIIIFPNPTTGEFKVQEFKSSRVQGVEIFDIYGRKIQSFSPSVLQSFNISGFSAGIYFIKISTETGIITKKIIKY